MREKVGKVKNKQKARTVGEEGRETEDREHQMMQRFS